MLFHIGQCYSLSEAVASTFPYGTRSSLEYGMGGTDKRPGRNSDSRALEGTAGGRTWALKGAGQSCHL